MIYPLANAVVVLIFIFYLNTVSFLFPITFGYIYMLYGLKNLPALPNRGVFIALILCGLLLSFINGSFLIFHEILIIMLVGYSAWIMDAKTLHGIPCVIIVIISLISAQLLTALTHTIYGWFGGAVILLGRLGYMHHHLNLYLDTHPVRHQPQKQLILKPLYLCGCFLALALGLSIAYQEYCLSLDEVTFDSYCYTAQKSDDILLEQPVILTAEKSGISYRGLHGPLLLSAAFYEADELDLTLYFEQSQHYLEHFTLFKKEDAPAAISTDTFNVWDYYQDISASSQQIRITPGQYVSKSPLLLHVMGLNNGSAEGCEHLQAEISLTQENTLHKSRHFFIQINWSQNPYLYDGWSSEIRAQVQFSLYLDFWLNQAEKIQYQLIAIDRTTSQQLLLAEDTEFDWEGTGFPEKHQFYWYLEKPLDSEKYDYSANIIFYQNDVQIHQAKVAMNP